MGRIDEVADSGARFTFPAENSAEGKVKGHAIEFTM